MLPFGGTEYRSLRPSDASPSPFCVEKIREASFPYGALVEKRERPQSRLKLLWKSITVLLGLSFNSLQSMTFQLRLGNAVCFPFDEERAIRRPLAALELERSHPYADSGVDVPLRAFLHDPLAVAEEAVNRHPHALLRCQSYRTHAVTLREVE